MVLTLHSRTFRRLQRRFEVGQGEMNIAAIAWATNHDGGQDEGKRGSQQEALRRALIIEACSFHVHDNALRADQIQRIEAAERATRNRNL